MVCKALLAALLLIAVPAHALVKAGPPVLGAHHRLKSAGAGGALGNVPTLPQPTAAYSVRYLVTGYPGKALRLRRASDNAEQDIGFAGVDFDTAAATTFCAATTCFVRTWYDQSGNARDVVMTTAANQPAFIFSCLGSSPCVQTAAASQTLNTAANGPAATFVSFSAVVKRVAGTATCIFITQTPNNRVQTFASGTGIQLVGNATNSLLASTATENQWHSVNAVDNGASSYIATDGTTVSGNIAAVDTTAGLIRAAWGNNSVTCNQVEAVVWANYTMTAGEAAALNTNQHAYWGF